MGNTRNTGYLQNTIKVSDPGANGNVFVRQTTGSTQTVSYSILRIA